MEPMAGKGDAIRSAVAQLRARFGGKAFDLIDWWPDDPGLIGLARPGEDEPVVCVLASREAEGRFDVEYGGTLHRGCVIQGVIWAVRETLGRRG